MSTTALVRFQAQSETRSATQGVAYIPNSIVENQALLTPAELALVLIVCRRGENTVSDRHWEAWTGKDPKMKNHAIRGLRDKGLRQIGRGSGAKFAFDRNAWDSWVRSRPRHERARTLGRSKSVSAKAGQMIHPECRERGCQKLCDAQPGVISISQAPTTPNWKPVSNIAKSSPAPPGASLTLAAIQTWFPHADGEFEAKLRAAVEQKVKVQYSDADLAQAVRLAYKRDQEREGLFLHTVPARLAHILRRSRTSNPPSTEQTHTPAQIQEFLNERAEQLRKAGMNDLARQLEQLEPDLAAESQLEQIEAAVIARLRGRTPVSVFKEAVDQEMKPHSKGKTQEQIERLRTQFTDRKLLDGAGIGRLSLSWL
jgi:hypothetical protein